MFVSWLSSNNFFGGGGGRGQNPPSWKKASEYCLAILLYCYAETKEIIYESVNLKEFCTTNRIVSTRL